MRILFLKIELCQEWAACRVNEHSPANLVEVDVELRRSLHGADLLDKDDIRISLSFTHEAPARPAMLRAETHIDGIPRWTPIPTVSQKSGADFHVISSSMRANVGD
jgi:hypothetical protein